MFFSFDGIDGVGKTTQMAQFVQWLQTRGHEVVVCRDPGGTALGDRLREILLDKSDTPICRRSEMLLYMASRAQLVEQIIRPALAAGSVVVSDRFLLANVVYQGHAGGLDVGDLWQVGRVAIDGIYPDRVFLLDLTVEQAVLRRNREPDRIESQGDHYMELVRQGYLAETNRRGEIVIIDADGSVDEIQQRLRSAAEDCLGDKG